MNGDQNNGSGLLTVGGSDINNHANLNNTPPINFGATGTGNNTQPGQSEHRGVGPKAPAFSDLMKSLGANAALSSEGQDFLKRVRANLEDPVNNFKVITQRLSFPNEAYAFMDEQRTHGMLIVFKEAQDLHQDSDSFIPGVLFNTTSNARQELPETVRILNTILIKPEDYKRDQAYSTHIRSAIACAASQEFNGMSIESVCNQKFVIDGNIDRVLAFYKKHSPHEVAPTTQYGFTVNLVVRNDNVFSANSKDNYTTMAIAAVCGFTDFIAINHSFNSGNYSYGGTTSPMRKFIPIANISEIVSVVPATPLIPMFLWMALNVFIYGEMWKSPFSDFGTNEGMNIGNLIAIADPTNSNAVSTYSVKNVKEREEFIAYYCERPALVLNVVEGRARIPGMDCYADPNRQDEILVQYSSFLNKKLDVSNITNEMRPVIQQFSEYVGNAILGGNVSDSRWISFLYMLSKDKSDRDMFEPLLVRNDNNPGARMQLIKALTNNNYSTDYLNYICVLNANVLKEVSGDLTRRINVVSDINNTASTVDINTMLNMAREYATGGGIFSGFSSGAAHGYNYNFMNSPYGR